jgi:hypothetical protein
MRSLGCVKICGIDWEVFEGEIKEDRGLADAYGYTDYEAFRIVLRSGMPPTAFLNTLLHEMQHALWEHSGLKSHVGKDSAFEETFIQIFTPVWIDALRSAKKLRANGTKRGRK